MNNYYDSIAEGYEDLHRDEQFKKLSVIKEYLEVKKDDLMLDVGCGPGFSSKFFDCKIIGLDSSKELLKKCSFETVCGVAEKIPFPDNHFDIVISLSAIHNFTDYKKGLLEMKRVCKETLVLTLLKKAIKLHEIVLFIEDNFVVNRLVDEDKDLIFFCE